MGPLHPSVLTEVQPRPDRVSDLPPYPSSRISFSLCSFDDDGGEGDLPMKMGQKDGEMDVDHELIKKKEWAVIEEVEDTGRRDERRP